MRSIRRRKKKERELLGEITSQMRLQKKKKWPMWKEQNLKHSITARKNQLEIGRKILLKRVEHMR